jgi:pimeloyl-ACP methyl ester carboxylesterase
MQRTHWAVPSVLLFSVGACAPLTSFERVREKVPAAEFVQVHGQCVHFERSGSGPTLVLLHGFGGSTYSWHAVTPALAAPFDVIAIDLNGFGYTQRPDESSAYTLDAQVELVEGVCAALGVGAAHVVGHSYGGGVALLLAERHPERVASIVLVDGGWTGSATVRGGTVPRCLRPLFLTMFKAFFLNAGTVRNALLEAVHDDSVVTTELVAEYLKRLRVDGLDAAFHGLNAAAEHGFPAIDLEQVTQATLILWGEEDRVITIEAAELLLEALPQARLVRFPETGHLLMEEQPERLVDEVTGFVGSVEARP